MALPYATRCAMQALRESSDERAQNAYASLVEAFVSGEADDIQTARRALAQLRSVPLGGIVKVPARCESELFRPLHDEAVATASKCGVSLSDGVLSEQRAADARASIAYLSIVVVLVLFGVLVHAGVQRCKPAAMCAVRE